MESETSDRRQSRFGPNARSGEKMSSLEIVIFLVLLGVTGWVAIPQFTEAQGNTRFVSLNTELHSLRAAIQAYREDHDGRYPTAEQIVVQLTQTTDQEGNACEAKPDLACFGPYLAEIPVNPYTGGNRVTSALVDGLEGAKGDWYYDEGSGQVHPLGTGSVCSQ